MAFFQNPPTLGNQFETDRVLRGYLTSRLPKEILSSVSPMLTEMGELAGGSLYESLQTDPLAEPSLRSWDAWGNRIEEIALTPHWQRASKIAAEKGLVATAYERKYAEYSRIVQFALVYLFDASSAVYTCPLAMTDGAAKTLLALGNDALVARALPRLTSRNPETMWTSGQWMTERTGGSDVAISETVAKQDGDGHRLYGTKWFTSATTSQMALTLARPEGNPPSGSGLALFYLEVRNADETMNGITIHRLKSKLGTRMVPTAELLLDGARATPVSGLKDGIKNISHMLNVTRTWNAIAATANMRRGIALARDYAKKRVAFGAPLSDKPLHAEMLADLQAEFEAGLLLTFRAVELLGREEARVLTDDEKALLRLVTPLAKLTTGRQVVRVASEVLEAFGGAGYVEDTGLPRLLRDAQVYPIWEGTTNVLSLDVLRALGKEQDLGPFAREIGKRLSDVSLAAKPMAEGCQRALSNAVRFVTESRETPRRLEAGARRLALTLGRTLALSLLLEEASRAERRGDPRPLYAAKRFHHAGIDWLHTWDETETFALANDTLAGQ